LTAHSASAGADARPARDALGAALAVLAIAAAVVGLAFRPALLTPGAFVVALAAVIASPRWRAFAAVAALVAGVCFFAAMIIAVATEHPLF
jgi:hypothetical protein